jgi:hypothetical protein
MRAAFVRRAHVVSTNWKVDSTRQPRGRRAPYERAACRRASANATPTTDPDGGVVLVTVFATVGTTARPIPVGTEAEASRSARPI